METYLAVPEIKAKFDSEWVLVSEPQTNDNLEVQAGKVIFHSKDRDEVYREAKTSPETLCLALHRDNGKRYGYCFMNHDFDPKNGIMDGLLGLDFFKNMFFL